MEEKLSAYLAKASARYYDSREPSTPSEKYVKDLMGKKKIHPDPKKLTEKLYPALTKDAVLNYISRAKKHEDEI